MLVVYTPDKQSNSSVSLYSQVLNCCNGSRVPNVCRTNEGIAIKMSWCREVVTDNLRGMLSNAPPGRVNLYGIRKHGTSLQYQPRCPGKISRRVKYTDNLLSGFFQLMVECISSTLEGSTMSERRITDYIYRWNAVTFDRDYPIASVPAVPNIKCLLNADEEDIPELEDTSLWSSNKMFGNIINIPSKWVGCVPIMSYLMYIPRLWGVFYSSPRVLPKLSKLSRYKISPPSWLRDIIGNPRGYSASAYSSQLWSAVALRLMLPSWFTPCGKEYFWAFTYLLMRQAVFNSYREDNMLPGIKEALYTESSRGGFKSWCGWYRSNGVSPKWFKDMIDNLYLYGVSSIFNVASIVSYI